VLYHGSGFQLRKLFAPEHGIDGTVQAGHEYSNSRDRRTGLPVYALYNTPEGSFRHPTRQMFSGLDAVVYDVQDLGNRSYTFISTLGYVMDEAAKDNIEVIVLDRPNPLGGVRIEGPRLDSSFTPSFVGLYDIPCVYGLTPGELALWINAKYLPRPCRLTVVAMRGWTRPMVWEDTGLNWIPTSPNIPTAAAARAYSATGLLGEIGIESGCGGPHPFQVVLGRDWDGRTITQRFNALRVPGVHARPWGDGDQEGMFLDIDPRNAGNLTAVNLQVLGILEDEVDHFSIFGGTSFDQRDMFDKICGNTSIRRRLADGASANSVISSWNSGVARWAVERQPYLLYGMHPSAPEKKPSEIAQTSPMP
jgi:uncharacterized protein YbbC (DUF1343 family)